MPPCTDGSENKLEDGVGGGERPYGKAWPDVEAKEGGELLDVIRAKGEDEAEAQDVNKESNEQQHEGGFLLWVHLSGPSVGFWCHLVPKTV